MCVCIYVCVCVCVCVFFKEKSKEYTVKSQFIPGPDLHFSSSESVRFKRFSQFFVCLFQR